MRAWAHCNEAAWTFGRNSCRNEANWPKTRAPLPILRVAPRKSEGISLLRGGGRNQTIRASETVFSGCFSSPVSLTLWVTFSIVSSEIQALSTRESGRRQLHATRSLGLIHSADKAEIGV